MLRKLKKIHIFLRVFQKCIAVANGSCLYPATLSFAIAFAIYAYNIRLAMHDSAMNTRTI